MIALTVVVIVVLFAVIYVIDRSARARDREHAREKMAWNKERGELLNRIMYMAHKPWDGPPSPVEEERVDPYDDFAFPHEIVGTTESELIG